MVKIPLAERLRPASFDEVVGQEHLLGTEGFITRAIQTKRPVSIILWGPPGSGKTTIARLYSKAFGGRFIAFSAVFSGVADLRKVVKETEEQPMFDTPTILFVDEIHRFNKAQQDGFLPYIERGTFILIGATTENPSFSLNDALLSRTHVLVLNALSEQDMEKILERYESYYGKLPLEAEARSTLLHLAQGDGRYLINLVEALENVSKEKILSTTELTALLQRRAALFDRQGDGHYNLISALHKAVRGSDPDASLYWFARILEGGEDPLFIARRMIRMASEDIGLADPQALVNTIAAREAYQTLGSPEGELALAQALIYLALAPKSNALYKAYTGARREAASSNHLPPPSVILNAPTKLMKQLDYGKGYLYDHDQPDAFSGQNYFPDGMSRSQYYFPVERGFEREMIKRIQYFASLRKRR